MVGSSNHMQQERRSVLCNYPFVRAAFSLISTLAYLPCGITHTHNAEFRARVFFTGQNSRRVSRHQHRVRGHIKFTRAGQASGTATTADVAVLANAPRLVNLHCPRGLAVGQVIDALSAQANHVRHARTSLPLACGNYVRSSPVMSFGIAMGIGFVLSRMMSCE